MEKGSKDKRKGKRRKELFSWSPHLSTPPISFSTLISYIYFQIIHCLFFFTTSLPSIAPYSFLYIKSCHRTSHISSQLLLILCTFQPETCLIFNEKLSIHLILSTWLHIFLHCHIIIEYLVLFLQIDCLSSCLSSPCLLSESFTTLSPLCSALC